MCSLVENAIVFIDESLVLVSNKIILEWSSPGSTVCPVSEIARSEQDMLDNLLYQASILAQGGQDWQKTLKCLKRLYHCKVAGGRFPRPQPGSNACRVTTSGCFHVHSFDSISRLV